MSTRRQFLKAALALGGATAVWLPSMQGFASPAPDALRPGSDIVEGLLAAQLAPWVGGPDGTTAQLRATNPEWDFMGRTFLGLALANLCLGDPRRRGTLLPVLDRILADTLATVRARGATWFLLPYGRTGRWRGDPPRSVFVHGELALVLAARRLVQDDPVHADAFAEQVEAVRASMSAGPIANAESYPDECWLFCNTLGLAALRAHEVLDGADHGALIARWLRTARERLVHPASGMLVSSYTWDGVPKDGPEGSSIFLAAHALQVVDAALANDQYRRARSQLGRDLLGFGFALEWPASWVGPTDVDSGPIVPVVGASAGASGLAVVAARAFGDESWLRSLFASLELAAFPIRTDGQLRYGASNRVGDAVLLYALVQGPMWRVLGAEVPT